MRILAVLTILLLVPCLTTAESAVASVYVYDRPDVSANIVLDDEDLVCKWTIADRDAGDSHDVEVKWYLNSEHLTELDSEHNCIAGTEYSVKHEIEDESGRWECFVSATDTYGASANATASYYVAQEVELGAASPIIEFISSIFSSVTSFVAFWS